MNGNVIGVLELSNTAVGIMALDTMAKKAAVRIMEAKTICPGKYYIIITGEVADVDAALNAGKKAGSGYCVDELFITNLHDQVIPSILGTRKTTRWDAVGILETFSLVCGIESADTAAKAADVELIETRLATGMAGKSFVSMTGALHDVETSMKMAKKRVEEKGLLCVDVIIPRAHPDIRPFVV